jgi:hypothetical protein
MKQRLDDALVFLSACETGQVSCDSRRVIGFGQAFLQADARVVIASLWKVAHQLRPKRSRLHGERLGEVLAGDEPMSWGDRCA